MRLTLYLFAGALLLTACGRPGLDERAKKACGDAGVKSAATGPTGDVIECQPQIVEDDAASLPSTLLDVSDVQYTMKPVAELGLSGTESPQDIGDLLVSRFGGRGGEGNYTESVQIKDAGANVTVTFSAEGFADDSVKGEQHVVFINLPAAVPAGVTGYGVRYKCWRGSNRDKWQKELCP